MFRHLLRGEMLSSFRFLTAEVFAGVSTQCRGAKTSTYLAGLPVDPEAAEKLPLLYKELLAYVKEKIPEGVAYREHVERYCNTFLKTVTESPSQADAEAVIGRQYEELINDVTKERLLVDSMASWEPWKTEGDKAPALFAELKDIPSNVNAFREYQHQLGTSK